jgi:hypothetical protein
MRLRHFADTPDFLAESADQANAIDTHRGRVCHQALRELRLAEAIAAFDTIRNAV